MWNYFVNSKFLASAICLKNNCLSSLCTVGKNVNEYNQNEKQCGVSSENEK